MLTKTWHSLKDELLARRHHTLGCLAYLRTWLDELLMLLEQHVLLHEHVVLERIDKRSAVWLEEHGILISSS